MKGATMVKEAWWEEKEEHFLKTQPPESEGNLIFIEEIEAKRNKNFRRKTHTNKKSMTLPTLSVGVGRFLLPTHFLFAKHFPTSNFLNKTPKKKHLKLSCHPTISHMIRFGSPMFTTLSPLCAAKQGCFYLPFPPRASLLYQSGKGLTL